MAGPSEATPPPPPPSTMGTNPQASLYVGDLHPIIDNLQLTNLFSEYKSLSFVRVCRDPSTGRSLCYGYANFSSQQDAIHAIETRNNTIFYGKMIRVTWSCRNPDLRRSGVGNVFVKNLAKSFNNVRLQELFSGFGNILSCKVAVFENGKSKGYGFVQFESEEYANAAIERLNGTDVGGRKIYVAKFVKKSDRILPGRDAKYTNLYIKNLGLDLTEDILEQTFAKFGKIVSLVIARDDYGVSKGFGFVNFENPNDARKAVEAMNDFSLGSGVLYVARAQKKAEREQILRRQYEDRRKEHILKYRGSNVYVKNIDDDVTEEELREHFSQCGTIKSVRLMYDAKGLSRCFGFVCFSTPQEARTAINSLNGYIFHHKPLYVALAERKEHRQALLQAQREQQLAGLLGQSSVIQEACPSFYYTSPTGMISHVTPQPVVMYQPLGVTQGWRADSFPPLRPAFQPSPPSFTLNAGSRPFRQQKGRVNGHSAPYTPHLPTNTSREPSSNQQVAGQVKYMSNGRARDVNKGAAASSDVPTGEGKETLTGMLSDASPEIQKRILGDRLYPLVNELKPNNAEKITGMLLEMEMAELLILLESPESLAAKVDEAVQALEASKTKASSQDPASQPT